MMTFKGIPLQSVQSSQNGQRRSKYIGQGDHGKIKTMISIGLVFVPIWCVLLIVVLPIGQCAINITVTSTDPLSPVYYEVYVDGEMEGGGILASGQSFIWTITYNMALFPKEKEIVVSAMGTSNELGALIDNETLSITSGGTYNVALNMH